jgi:hypothetical protein
MPMIEIWDGPTVQLNDLLAQVPPADLDWAILEIWATGRDDAPEVVELDRRAAESPTGVALSDQALRQLAAEVLQVIDGIVVGYRGAPPVRSDADLRDVAEVVFEAIDSTLWRVYARDVAVLDRIRQRYHDVRDISPEVVIPPVHEES